MGNFSWCKRKNYKYQDDRNKESKEVYQLQDLTNKKQSRDYNNLRNVEDDRQSQKKRLININDFSDQLNLIMRKVPSQPYVYLKKQWFIKQKQQNIREDYDMKMAKQLGEGGFGTVIKARNKSTNEMKAIKIIQKSCVLDKEEFLNEISILQDLDHPNVIKLFEFYEDKRYVYLVTELCEGGELFDYIVEKGNLTERESRFILQQICSAISYCHGHGICHRDLKPENFLLESKGRINPLKVIDFGLSCKFFDYSQGKSNKQSMHQQAGSVYYIAPEVLQGNYNELCDVWSIGVILYIMLSGSPPFNGINDYQTYDLIKQGHYTFNNPQFKHISESAKDLIRKCLCPVNVRLTAQQVCQHQWMIEELPDIKIDLHFSQLANFHKMEKLKKIALTYIASQMSETEISELGNLFKKLDKDNDGVLSVEEIKQGLDSNEFQQAQDIDKIIRSMDTDGSGQINYTEFIAASMAKSIYCKQEKIQQSFRMLDRDGNGKIDVNELKQLLQTNDKSLKDIGMDEKYWNSMIREVDKNGDGQIDYTEFMEMMQPTK